MATMPTRPALRLADEHDAPALASFAAQAFADTYRGLDEPQDIADYVAEHFAVDAFERVLRDPACTTLLAEATEGLAGYAQLRQGPPPDCVAGPDPIELARLYLAARSIGRGLGAWLMHEVHAQARRLGARTIWLGVYDRNLRAVRFYERSGFRCVGGKAFAFGGRLYTDPVYAAPVSDGAVPLTSPA